MRRVWMILAVVALGAVGCSQGAFTEQADQAGGGGLTGAPDGREAAPQPGGETTAGQELPSLEPTIIRTASLELQVASEGFSTAVDRATAVATANGGFIVESSVEGRDARSGSMVLRVPAERFDSALAELRRLGEVRAERISSQDVGEEFVDLEARRRHLTTQERVMLDLMAEAQTVAATIQVQHELEDIQLEIERIEGRLRFLQDQTALGTITLHLVEEGVAPAEPPGMLAKAWSAAVEGFFRVVAAGVVLLGYLAPFAILAAIAFLVWVRFRRARPRPAGEA